MIEFWEKFIFLRCKGKFKMKRLLITSAINEEFKLLKGLLQNKEVVKGRYKRCTGTIAQFPVEIIMTSLGMKAAREVAKEVIIGGEYGGVLVVGYCGGLSSSLKIGDTVIPNEILNPNLQSTKLDSSLSEVLGRAHVAEGLHYRSVRLITQERVIELPKDKQALHSKSSAEAVDMESSEIIEQALKNDVRGAVVKIVIDDVDTELPKFNEYFERTGKLDHYNVAPVFVAQPSLSLQLSRNMKRANQIFQKSIPAFMPVLCQYWNIAPLN
jgi:nucleoside phosphorylase